MQDGVVLYEDQSISELLNLAPGTPITVHADGAWWAYLSDGAGGCKPVCNSSFSDSGSALQAARRALAA